MRASVARMTAAVVVVATCLHADGGAQDDPARVTDFLWRGVQAHREQLQSGIFRADGRYLDDSPAEQVHVEKEVHVFCAFDYAEDLLRFDRLQPDDSAAELAEKDTGSPDLSKVRGLKGLWGGKYARGRDVSTYASEGDNQVSVRARDHALPPMVRVFDVRAIGLCYFSNLDRGTTLSELLELYKGQSPTEVLNDGKGISRIRWRLAADHLRTVCIDEQRGFTSIRLEVAGGAVKPGEEGDWASPTIVSDVSWIEVSGVWVPKTYHIENTLSSGRKCSYDLAFEWESVNKPIPYVLFTAEGFDLKRGTYIVDVRLGKPIITGAIGRNSVPEFGIIESRDEPPRRRNATATIWVLGSVAVLLVVGIVIGYRRIRAGQNP